MDIKKPSHIWDLNLNDFQNAIASDSPTPGGGSVTIVSACFGLSLIIMAIEITSKKDKSSILENFNEKAKAILKDMSLYADKDIEVFNNYMNAFKLPKDSDEQLQIRLANIERCVVQATETPLKAAEYILEALNLALEVLPLIKKTVVSDIGAGVSMLYGALQGLLLNVDINLPNIKNAEAYKKYEYSKKELLSAALNLYTETSTNVLETLNTRPN